MKYYIKENLFTSERYFVHHINEHLLKGIIQLKKKHEALLRERSNMKSFLKYTN